MELIEPHLIPDAILRLIDEANHEIKMVTPTCKISNWTNFLKRMDYAKKRGIAIDFFIKDGDYKSIAEVEALNMEPIIVKNLNSIIFINEQYAIIATKSLMYSEDGSALEIAFKTSDKFEYLEIKHFFEKYITKATNTDSDLIPIHRYMKFEVGRANLA